MDAIRFQKNTLTEKIESIDYTHLLGYPSEVVALEIITMVKDIISSEVNMKETNMEHYGGEIEAIILEDGLFGLSKEYGTIDKCHKIGCANCDFIEKGISCDVGMVKWLMSEYKPEPVLTVKEKGFVECIEDGWLARDKNNELNWYEIEPNKDKSNKWWAEHVAGGTEINKDYFPFITWEDEEPWSVEELRKLKVQE